jgi:Ion channel
MDSALRNWTPTYGLVLLLIVLAIVIAAIANGAPVGRFLSLLVLSAALLLSFRVAEASARTRRLASVLVGLGILLGTILIVADRDRVGVGLDVAVTAVLVAVTPVVLSRRLVLRRVVDSQSILGAVCVYLLIGLWFAFSFSLTTLFTGSPFFAQQVAASTTDYLYFSFTTLTTVGYGDLAPRSDVGRLLAVTEALSGQLYLVTVVGVLVTNLRPRPRDHA